MAFECRANPQLAVQLGAPVRVDRVGRVVFDVWSALLTVEHLVTADVYDDRAALLAGLGHESRRFAVVARRSCRLGLAARRVGPGGGVDDGTRPQASERVAAPIGVGRIEVRADG